MQMMSRRRANPCCWLLVSGLISTQSLAMEAAIDAEFLEFLGSMVESEGELVGPLDLHDAEIIGMEENVESRPDTVVSQSEASEVER